MIWIVDGILTIVFLGDFTYRLLSADTSAVTSSGERGWLDLVGSLPLLRVFRSSAS